MTLRELQTALYKVQREHFPLNENRDQKLLLITGEIVEAQNELREGHGATYIYYVGSKPEGYPIELADALIRILNLMSDDGLDAEELVQLKNGYNSARPYMHGKAF